MASIDGVDKVEVDFKKKTAKVTMKNGKALTQDQVAKALKTKGFSVTSFAAA